MFLFFTGIQKKEWRVQNLHHNNNTFFFALLHYNLYKEHIVTYNQLTLSSANILRRVMVHKNEIRG